MISARAALLYGPGRHAMIMDLFRVTGKVAGYLTGKILDVDGGIERPNLDLGIPGL